MTATGDELTDKLRESKIPLNAWGPIGREESATEDYAYAATLEVARQIAERAGRRASRRCGGRHRTRLAPTSRRRAPMGRRPARAAQVAHPTQPSPNAFSVRLIGVA